ncbi:MAG: OmpH family outer membrane protein [Planctomycetota bacterium]
MNTRRILFIGFSLLAVLSFLAGSLIPLARAEESNPELLAFVDKTKVAKSMRLAKTLEAKIQRMKNDGAKRLNVLRVAIGELRDELKVLASTKPLYWEKLKDLRRKELILKHEEKMLQEDLERALLRATERTHEAIAEVCRAMRKEKGYTAVLAVDNPDVLAWDPKRDITPQVIEAANR